MKQTKKQVAQISPKTKPSILLQDYKSLLKIKSEAEKQIKELKEKISAMEAGQYDNFVLAFEEREVKEYIVKSRTDRIIKVLEIGE